MINKAILMGRLTRDPELRHTQNNKAVASFTIAVDRARKTDGQPTADFIDIVAWGTTAEFVTKWFAKGQPIAIVGRIQTRNWEDKNGCKRTAVEVIADEVSFTGSKKDNAGGGAPARQNDSYSVPAPNYDLPNGSSDFSEIDDDDGEVPF